MSKLSIEQQHLLIETHMGIARSAALQAAKKGESFEEAYADALLGLCDAANTYDTCGGAAFSSHAFVRCRGAILDGLRRMDERNRSLRDACHAYARAHAELIELGFDPSHDQIAEWAGLQASEAFLARTHMQRISLDDEVDGQVGLCYADVIASRARSVEDEVCDRDVLRRAFEKMSARERRLVAKRFILDMRIDEVAAEERITASRVSQIVREAA